MHSFIHLTLWIVWQNDLMLMWSFFPPPFIIHRQPSLTSHTHHTALTTSHIARSRRRLNRQRNIIIIMWLSPRSLICVTCRLSAQPRDDFHFISIESCTAPRSERRWVCGNGTRWWRRQRRDQLANYVIHISTILTEKSSSSLVERNRMKLTECVIVFSWLSSRPSAR